MVTQLCTLSLLLVFAQGKPVTYDQRQDGSFNLHAQLDNIMIVIATPGDKGPSSLFSDIASQILELRSLTSRNKKVSVEDEEIVEQGKDPLSVRILRIEGQNDAEGNGGQSQGLGSLNLSEELPGEGAAVNQIRAFDLSKIDDIQQIMTKTDKYIKDTIKEMSNKKMEEKPELIPESLEKEVPLIAGQQDIILSSAKQEIPEMERLPGKLVFHGTIVEVDKATGKIVHNFENKKPIENKPSDKKLAKIDIQEKIFEKSGVTEDKEKITPELQEKAPIILQVSEKMKEKISPVSEEIAILPKQLENQEEKIKKQGKPEISEAIENKVNKEKKIAVKNEDKVDSKGERTERELRAPANDSKSRMSWKKELPRIEDLNEEYAPSDKNEVRLIVKEISQLKPIGDMIENCGPGRIRNRYGICQFDESFN
ncbi:uncharacterized protein LOC117178596 [Belonocnema kinseyi]|uniref:uncharacterized protein LOC117178596 n=1 Tax=Belonocnema kinseyi TaxID=2817044 RepID=UPI00143D43AE|nr:uncharacterized protein LOC117178596 [Belonocnema kinseyi]